MACLGWEVGACMGGLVIGAEGWLRSMRRKAVAEWKQTWKIVPSSSRFPATCP